MRRQHLRNNIKGANKYTSHGNIYELLCSLFSPQSPMPASSKVIEAFSTLGLQEVSSFMHSIHSIVQIYLILLLNKLGRVFGGCENNIQAGEYFRAAAIKAMVLILKY